MTNPIADSVTIRTNKVNNWSIISSKEMKNTKKFELTANGIDLIRIDIIGIFCLLRKICQMPYNICHIRFATIPRVLSIPKSHPKPYC